MKNIKDIITGDPLGIWKQCPKDWNEYKLWDIADYINGRAFKPTDFSFAGLPVIKITELKYGISPATTLYAGGYEKKFLLKNGDLLFAWSGNPETSLDAFRWSGGKALLNQHIFRVIPRDFIESTFLYFLFKYLRSTFVRTARDKATSMGHVKISDLKRLIAKIPPLPEQRAIASILGALDDKIELNRRMNETLEAMARAIFKSWFVDFEAIPGLGPHREWQDSPIGRIPKGWRVESLGEIIELAYGKALKEDLRQPGIIAVYGSNGQVGWHNEKIVEGPGIVVGRKGNPGVVTWTPTDCYPIDTTFYVVPKEPIKSMYYLYQALKLQDLPSLGADSAVPGLNRKMAYMNKIIVPPANLLLIFDKQVKSLADKVNANNEQSRTLATIRDALLPKLLSGEIRVKDATKFTKAV